MRLPVQIVNFFFFNFYYSYKILLVLNFPFFFFFYFLAIDLQQCGLSTDSASIFLEILRNNKSLVVLDLRDNNLISKFTKSMVHAFFHYLFSFLTTCLIFCNYLQYFEFSFQAYFPVNRMLLTLLYFFVSQAIIFFAL